MELSRRDLLVRATLGTATLGVLGSQGVLGAIARASDNGVYPRFIWEPVTSITAPRADSLFPAMLPAGVLTPSTALDEWYLWFWTHNTTTKLYLYTAPSPEGPFTGPRTLLSGMPTTQPFPAGYVSGHFDSGDIVWDAANSRYVSSPHSIRSGPRPAGLGETPQESFLIESKDGVNWDWLDGNSSPRLLCGPPGSADDVHTGYGRLLRDLDGHLTTANGRYQWIYRAQQHEPDWADVGSQRVQKSTLYRPWLASTPSLSAYPWVKDASQAFAALAQPDASLIGFGSFLVAVGQYWVEYACATSFSVLPGDEMLLGGAATVDGMLTAKQTPIALPPDSSQDVRGTGTTVAPGGGYIIRDPKTGKQYMVVEGVNPLILGNGHGLTEMPRFTVYRAVVGANSPLAG